MEQGAIGDVKYSVLELKEFRDHNGKGWFYANGVEEISFIDANGKKETKKISLTELKMQKLPDARGVFIRGMNLDQTDPDKSDPYAQENKGEERKVGIDPQTDLIKVHIHNQSAMERPGGGNGQYGIPRQDCTSTQSTANYTGGVEGANMQGSETRPKNIALYVYIKVF